MDESVLTTIGHGTLASEAFIDLLRSARMESLVDVRSFPGSRRNPQFNKEAMTEWIVEAGLSYRWERALGGFRKPKESSRNVGLRNASFRGYADYMETAAFLQALDETIRQARMSRTAIMCSESVWWRCHRRLIADAVVLARNVRVQHLLHDHRLAEHVLTDGVRLECGLLAYDRIPGQERA